MVQGMNYTILGVDRWCSSRAMVEVWQVESPCRLLHLPVIVHLSITDICVCSVISYNASGDLSKAKIGLSMMPYTPCVVCTYLLYLECPSGDCVSRLTGGWLLCDCISYLPQFPFIIATCQQSTNQFTVKTFQRQATLININWLINFIDPLGNWFHAIQP